MGKCCSKVNEQEQELAVKLLEANCSEISQKEKPLKFVFVGDAGTGKTSIINHIVERHFVENTITTTCAELKMLRISVGEKMIKIMLWDTPGGKQFRKITRSFYHKTDCFIIVYDVQDMRSQDSLKSWIKDMKQVLGEELNDVPKIIIANKIDLNRDSRGSVSALEDSENCVAYLETSAKTGLNMDRILTEIGSVAAKLV